MRTFEKLYEEEQKLHDDLASSAANSDNFRSNNNNLQIEFNEHDEFVFGEHIETQMLSSPEFARFDSMIRPWKAEAIRYLKNKYPQIIIKHASMAASLVVKFCRVKLILFKSSKIGFGITKLMQGSIVAEGSMHLGKIISESGVKASETLLKAGEQLVKVA